MPLKLGRFLPSTIQPQGHIRGTSTSTPPPSASQSQRPRPTLSGKGVIGGGKEKHGLGGKGLGKGGAKRHSLETNEEAIFCSIDGNTKRSIQRWLSRQQKSTFKPTFFRLSKARKDLAPTSIYPTLGLDSTLPQHQSPLDPSLNPTTIPQQQPRHSSNNQPHCSVLQDKYPVWYFFYGTLADPILLTRLLSLPESPFLPMLEPASFSGGVIKTWCGKDEALVDGEGTDHVYGSAYKFSCKEREEPLLLYAMEKYEVVRCCIVTVRHIRRMSCGDERLLPSLI